jgi:hypothetical protein
MLYICYALVLKRSVAHTQNTKPKRKGGSQKQLNPYPNVDARHYIGNKKKLHSE